MQAAHRVAAAARQPDIRRRRNTVRIVVRRSDLEIVGRGEVLVPTAIVAAGDRNAPAQVSLDLYGAVPIVASSAEALQHIFRIGGCVGIVPAEVQVRDLSALAV